MPYSFLLERRAGAICTLMNVIRPADAVLKDVND
jgi:hypothetical protein